jgi:Fic family protein
MNRGLQGERVRVTTRPEAFEAFLPNPLPPNPPLEMTGERSERIGQANRAIGRLDGLVSILPTNLFRYQYIRKEALLSSQIEGTQSSLSDLLLFESRERPGAPLNDVLEVANYVAALEHGLQRIRDGFPVSSRLIREVHARLLASGRGSHQTPGEFRRSQNWIGGSRPGSAVYVPPPHQEIPRLIGDLERFLHGETPDAGRVPLLLRAAMAHVQFESIHPFLDGNGRVGRLLVTLLLCDAEALSQPLLYLSLFLKENRDRYYELLQRVRLEGEWEEWVDFFLDGVTRTADQAAATARRLLDLFEEDRHRIEEALGRSTGSALQVHELMKRSPLVTVASANRELAITRPTVASSLERLTDIGLTRELDSPGRSRVYVYDAALAILAEGTEPLRTGSFDAPDRGMTRSGTS